MFTSIRQRIRSQAQYMIKAGCGAGLLLTTSSCTMSPVPQSATPLPKANKPVVALVLGAGGAKGLAHIGVIKTLEASGVHPDLIVGSSVGSLVGSLYASGMSAADLERLALSTPTEEITDFTLAHQGIIEGIKLKNFVNTHVDGRPIEALPIRFAAVASEKHTQQKTVFTSGNTGLVVQASCSVPNIFIAPRIPEKVGKKYVDGGVTSLVPVDTAHALGADVVIAVDVLSQNPSDNDLGIHSSVYSTKSSADKAYQPSPNIWSLLEQSYTDRRTNRRKYQQTQAEINRADVVIRPAVGNISSIDTARRIHLGEIAAAQQLPIIAEAIANAVAKPEKVTTAAVLHQ